MLIDHYHPLQEIFIIGYLILNIRIFNLKKLLLMENITIYCNYPLKEIFLERCIRKFKYVNNFVQKF